MAKETEMKAFQSVGPQSRDLIAQVYGINAQQFDLYFTTLALLAWDREKAFINTYISFPRIAAIILIEFYLHFSSWIFSLLGLAFKLF